MFDIKLPSVLLYLANSALSGIYVSRFLKARFPYKLTIAIWVIIYFAAQIVVFELVDSIYSVNAAFGAIINILILAVLQLLLFYKEISKQIFTAVSFMAGKEIIVHISSVFSDILFDIWEKISGFLLKEEIIQTVEQAKIASEITANIIVFFIEGLYVSVLYIYLRLICRSFFKQDYKLKSYENVYLILPSLTALCISITIKTMIISVENGVTIIIYDTVPVTKFWIPLICILLLFMIAASVLLFQKMLKGREEEQKRIILENSVEQMQRKIMEIQDIYEDMRGLKHDMRNHLNNILLYVKKKEVTDYEELNEYIGKIGETINRLDFDYRTGNPITDVIIHQKSQEAKKKQIQFSVDFLFPAEQKIDAYDIGIVLNNALNNAIEACQRLETGRRIALRSYVKGNLFFMEFENRFNGDILTDEETGLPRSNKEDLKLHGVGMSNIKRCAEKYLGDIDFEVSECDGQKLFLLTVMMYGQISHSK